MVSRIHIPHQNVGDRFEKAIDKRNKSNLVYQIVFPFPFFPDCSIDRNAQDCGQQNKPARTDKTGAQEDRTLPHLLDNPSNQREGLLNRSGTVSEGRKNL